MAKISGSITCITNGQSQGFDGVPVLLFDRNRNALVGSITSGPRGVYSFKDVGVGTYEIFLNDRLDLDNDGVPEWELARPSPDRKNVQVGRGNDHPPDVDVGMDLYRPSTDFRSPRLANRVTGAVEDVTVYPILTQANEYPAVAGDSLTGGVAGGSIGQIVDNTLRQVLGWRPRTSDPKGFLAALGKSFSQVGGAGQKHWQWTPHTYTIQADLGAVSGAQASIYSRAKNALLEQSVPLMEGLVALRPDADEEDLDAARAIVISELTELVNELGYIGGPRVQRVETYFFSLLGEPVNASPLTTDPDRVQGHLGELRDRFGLQRQLVNTLEEEENLTNYLILVDHVVSLRQTWLTQRHFFDRAGTDVFLGPQLVLLSRDLAVMAESVDEVRRIMDSVFLGPAERESIQLDLGDGEPRITIAEALNWTEHFATTEGPRLISEGGKDGVMAMEPTLDQLVILTGAIMNVSRGGRHNPTPGFHSPRVIRVLQELNLHTRTARDHVQQVVRFPQPLITSFNPKSGTVGEEVSLEVNGSGFRDGLAVRLTKLFETPIEGTGTTIVSPTQINASFDLAGAAPGMWTVEVTNPDNQRAFQVGAFTVQPAPAPVIHDIDPNSGAPGEDLDVTIDGENFVEDATVEFSDGSGIGVTHMTGSDQQLIVSITIVENAVPGSYDVSVKNPDGLTGTLPAAFKVTQIDYPPPVIHDIDPSSGAPGEDLEVTIDGDGFAKGASVEFGDGSDVEVTDTAGSGQQLIASITINGNAGPDSHIVRVINPDGQPSTSQVFFVVTEIDHLPPVIDRVLVSPFRYRDTIPMEIQGSGFREGDGFEVRSTIAHHIKSKELRSSSWIHVNLDWEPWTHYLGKEVAVINPDGKESNSAIIEIAWPDEVLDKAELGARATDTEVAAEIPALKIRQIRFDSGEGKQVHTVKAADLGNEIPALPISAGIQTVRLTFYKAIDRDTVSGEEGSGSFMIQALSGELVGRHVPLSVDWESDQIVKFALEDDDFDAFPAGKYQVTLFGRKDPTGKRKAIVGKDESRLEGGDFRFPLQITVDGDEEEEE